MLLLKDEISMTSQGGVVVVSVDGSGADSRRILACYMLQTCYSDPMLSVLVVGRDMGTIFS